MNIQDKAMHVRLDECIRETDHHYEKMTFSQTVKWSWHVLKGYVGKYKDYSKKCGIPMHRETMLRVVKSQVIMLSPIATHWCEHIWRNIFKESGSVTVADWPSLNTSIDQDEAAIVMLQADYLDDTIKDIKDRRTKAKKKKKKKKKGKAAEGETKVDLGPTTRGVFHVQTKYPSWKRTLLTFLDSKWDDSMKRVVKDGKEEKEMQGGFSVGKKEIIQEMGAMAKENDELKEQGKTLNKVLAFTMSAAEQRGRTALLHQMPFDEVATLKEFSQYIAADLQLSNGIEVVVDLEIVGVQNNGDVIEEPGKPFLVESV